MSAFSGNEDDKRPPAVSLSFPPRPPFAGLGGLTGGPFGSGSGSLPFSLKKRDFLYLIKSNPLNVHDYIKLNQAFSRLSQIKSIFLENVNFL